MPYSIFDKFSLKIGRQWLNVGILVYEFNNSKLDNK
jgi:hypothetical protein